MIDRLRTAFVALFPEIDRDLTIRRDHTAYTAADFLVSQSATPNAPKKTSIRLNSGNHVIYVGKQSENKRQRDESTYPDSFWQTMLPWASEQLADGAQMQIVLGPTLSRYCNDPSDQKGYMDFETQKAHVLSLAGKIHSDLPSRLNIVNLEESHVELFSAIKTSLDEHGQVDVRHLKENHSVQSPAQSSLDYALYLLRKVDVEPDLKDQFLGCLTSEQREHLPESGMSGPLAYPIFEVACRLWEAQQGRVFQGGVTRQNKYNKILVKLMNESPFKEKNMAFREFNIDPRKNNAWQAVKRAQATWRLQIRALTLGAGLAATGTLAVEAYEYGEEQAKADLIARFEGNQTILAGLADRTEVCHGLDSWYRVTEKRLIVKRFDSMMDAARSAFAVRYGIEVDELSWSTEWTALMLETVLEEERAGRGESPSLKNLMCDANDRPASVNFWLDTMVQRNSVFFQKVHGAWERPYSETLGQYEDKLRSAQNSSSQLEWNVDFSFYSQQFLGEYWDYSGGTELYWVQVDEQDSGQLVAKGHNTFSVMGGTVAAQAYFKEMQHWSSIPFNVFTRDLDHMQPPQGEQFSNECAPNIWTFDNPWADKAAHFELRRCQRNGEVFFQARSGPQGEWSYEQAVEAYRAIQAAKYQF